MIRCSLDDGCGAEAAFAAFAAVADLEPLRQRRIENRLTWIDCDGLSGLGEFDLDRYVVGLRRGRGEGFAKHGLRRIPKTFGHGEGVGDQPVGAANVDVLARLKLPITYSSRIRPCGPSECHRTGYAPP